MVTLNLTDLSKSGIKYKISTFPDSQKNITIESSSHEDQRDSLWQNPDLKLLKGQSVTIKSRMSWDDVQLIIGAVSALRELKVKEINLFVPYFLGARSDRKFEKGSNNYLKTVICPIINSLKLDNVYVLDPHSYVLEGCLNNFEPISNLVFTREAFRQLYGLAKSRKGNKFYLVSPDAGAQHKIYETAKDIDATDRIITCSKERDKAGKIISVNVPLDKSKHLGKDFVIIDDICDGGATFINIAKEIKEYKLFKDSKVYLMVTHAIQEAGLIKVSEYFDGIYCTNSVADYKLEKVTQINVF